MSLAEKLQEDFHCAKCSHTTCCIREVSMPASALTSIIIPKIGGRFLLATCTLCGYTEMFDMAVYCKEHEEESARKKGKKVASRPA